MAYIGKIKLTTTWAKVEDLIKAQVEGQSAFAFDSTKTYSIQSHSASLVNIANVAAAPASADDGECLELHMVAKYTPDTSILYVRSGAGKKASLSISELS